eukprot:CAMPEP_0202862962 /NCGR_PEP_ID=MMETSP1391-20130828/3802_1 /ASSEMBLY_ACC=CAM_ASM_000867 /TAXON_ID=1034604 /ORGANISM="Chlamydomonas leiostraca, Strain SAG 11-49" /LENGTH=38 /DNA_ID= /DNA_START= /DNA_END= /DNA_ORIENTATION=
MSAALMKQHHLRVCARLFDFEQQSPWLRALHHEGWLHD